MFNILVSNLAVELKPEDFEETLRGEIALDIAFVWGLTAKDKKAAMEALYHTADEIIGKVKTTPE